MSEYDYGAVCDFISARLYEANAILDDASSEHISILSNQEKNLYKTLHYEGTVVSVDFVLIGSKRKISFGRFNAMGIVPSDRKKIHLLERLGINPNNNSEIISAGCDAMNLKLKFEKEHLLEVQIYQTFD